MTVNKTRIAMLAAAALITLPLSMNIASAETVKPQSQQTVVLDTTPTGSIQRADSIRNCDPSSPNASAVCKITGGDPNARFPSAPISVFGF